MTDKYRFWSLDGEAFDCMAKNEGIKAGGWLV